MIFAVKEASIPTNDHFDWHNLDFTFHSNDSVNHDQYEK